MIAPCLVLLFVANLVAGAAWAQGHSLQAAAGKMTLAKGLQVQLFAGEPMVRQPILVKCDDRGRLWTIQYLQYPNPAGLKRVKVDRWSRTVYDRVPEPPPKGPRGADRITILEDTDGDGRVDRARDFVDGLNLATGLAFGHGGVFVLQVPYLLFYPDGNRDDVPDGPPRVLLKGFGMEDAQSLANHLTWGPDGWLYGVNGSTTTCRIRGIEFQQGCWRYHPPTDRFELFCEGGGNLFGLTFDALGRLFYSSNGGLFFHAVQGGYFAKSFAKHGPLHHLYTYGHFFPVFRGGLQGGPTTGGTIYRGHTLPEAFRGRFLCGNFLGHTSSYWDVRPRASTVAVKPNGAWLNSNDTWFGPTDLCFGPDGAVYISDFHDRRTAHPDPDAKWDRSNGRIYRVQKAGVASTRPVDVVSLPSAGLVKLLSHANGWYADRARIEMFRRRDKAIVPELKAMARRRDDRRMALQGLWAVNASGGLDDAFALEMLAHPEGRVRHWTVRLLGDRRKVSRRIGLAIVDLAHRETDPVVLVQLAATARRLSAETGLPVARELMQKPAGEADSRLPLMTWWAVEQHVADSRAQVIGLFETGSPLWGTRDGLGCGLRLVRRLAAEGTRAGYDACVSLLATVPGGARSEADKRLAQGLAERANGLTGLGTGGLFNRFGTTEASALKRHSRKFDELTPELAEYIGKRWSAGRDNTFWSDLAMRCRVDGSHRYARTKVADSKLPAETRARWLRLLRQYGEADVLPLGVKFFRSSEPAEVLAQAMEVLGRFGKQQELGLIVTAYPRLASSLQPRARQLVFGHPETALSLLALVDRGQVKAKTIDVVELRTLAIHKDPRLTNLIKKHWGRVSAGTAEEKLATMRRFKNDLRAGSGRPAAGRELFKKHCAACHKLFGEGGKIAPDLTMTSRKDLEALLANIVDPGAVIRRDFLASVVVTTNGRMVTGLVVNRKGDHLEVADSKGKIARIPKADVEIEKVSDTSIMPERLLEQLTPQQLRDLFSYLQGTAP